MSHKNLALEFVQTVCAAWRGFDIFGPLNRWSSHMNQMEAWRKQYGADRLEVARLVAVTSPHPTEYWLKASDEELAEGLRRSLLPIQCDFIPTEDGKTILRIRDSGAPIPR